MIPAGTHVLIPEGTEVNVAQSLGGSFTVYVDGNLLRIAGKDADALGRNAGSNPSCRKTTPMRTWKNWSGNSSRPAMTRRSPSTSWTWGWCTSAS